MRVVTRYSSHGNGFAQARVAKVSIFDDDEKLAIVITETGGITVRVAHDVAVQQLQNDNDDR